MRRLAKVLDKGYVRLLDHMGSDHAIANDARASFAKETETFTEDDARILRWLARDGHQSPFRSQVLKFEIKAPLMVARQWWKYKVASQHVEEVEGWNEVSRRYVTREPEFYVPDAWREPPETRKQGSGGMIEGGLSEHLFGELSEIQGHGSDVYAVMNNVVCAEQARLMIPAYGLYVTWRWTVTLPSFHHFYEERIAHDAQREIQEYAAASAPMVSELFPVAWRVLTRYSRRGRQEALSDRLNSTLETAIAREGYDLVASEIEGLLAKVRLGEF